MADDLELLDESSGDEKEKQNCFGGSQMGVKSVVAGFTEDDESKANCDQSEGDTICTRKHGSSIWGRPTELGHVDVPDRS
eukprot:Nk52_evm1s2193 gene=Nk52_evmTU1s2193